MPLTGNRKNTRSRQSRTHPGCPGACRGTTQKSRRGSAPGPAAEKSPLAQTKTSTPLAPHLTAFFEQRLPIERGANENTRDSYADAFQLLLTFASKRLQAAPSQLTVEQIDAPLVLDFLNDLETTRGNGASSRNIRAGGDQILPALPGVSRSVGDRADPAHPGDSRQENRVKTGPAADGGGIQGLLNSPDPTGWKGIRDRAMLHLCYAGGLRVSELVGLRLDDLQFEPQPSVLVHGKGRRERCLPLWKTTTSALRAWLTARGTVPVPELFVNTRGGSLTRSGFEYILRKHIRTVKQHYPSLATKRVHPHVLRHTCALTILQATKDLRKVSLAWPREDTNHGDVHASGSVGETGSPGIGGASETALGTL